MAHVLQIQPQHVKRAQLAAPADLPQPGDSRKDGESGLELARKHLRFPFQAWTRTNQRHFTAHHIKDLRQLVEASSTQQTPDSGDACVITQLEATALGCVRTLQLPRDQVPQPVVVAGRLHGTELEDREHAAVTADSALPEKGRSIAIHPYSCSD